jgi:hypothetical protein
MAVLLAAHHNNNSPLAVINAIPQLKFAELL